MTIDRLLTREWGTGYRQALLDVQSVLAEPEA